MNRRKKMAAGFAAVFLVGCFMAGASSRPVADVMIDSTGISWSPKVGCDTFVLTVACPDGSVISKTFEAGTTPYFELADIKAPSLTDGSYTYELQAVPLFKKRQRRVPDGRLAADVKLPPPLTQTGYFRVKGGAIVTPRSSEGGPARPMDEVIYDDLIVDGSLCVGNDCYSGLAFGFDTIVLMENNLRIYFDDTSNTSSFPNNDWRIVINDTTDGGGEYFAVQDVSGGLTPFTIEAGAKTNSLYVDDDGQVGIGTSGPVFELHIKEGDTPSVRLHQSTAYGWPEQIWDVGGTETSFFIRDGTHAARLPFRIEPETPTSTLCLKSDGKVGIGTWSPSEQVEIENTGAAAKLLLDRTDGATAVLEAQSTRATFGTETNHDFLIKTNGSSRVTIEAGGDVGIGTTSPSYDLHMGGGAYCTGTTWQSVSSRKYKENIESLTTEEAMNTLSELNPVKFNYKTEKDEKYVGFISEDVPELVTTKKRDAMNAMDVAAVLTKVVQEQQKMNQKQEETISALKKKIADLEKRLQTKK